MGRRPVSSVDLPDGAPERERIARSETHLPRMPIASAANHPPGLARPEGHVCAVCVEREGEAHPAFRGLGAFPWMAVSPAPPTPSMATEGADGWEQLNRAVSPVIEIVAKRRSRTPL